MTDTDGLESKTQKRNLTRRIHFSHLDILCGWPNTDINMDD